MAKNEFDEIDSEESYTGPVNEDVPPQANSVIASGTPGTVYDWNTAPEGTKAPPRINMNGMTVILNKVEIIIPPMDRPWLKTRKGDKEFKYASFVMHYDHKGQQEYYAGVRVFRRDDAGKAMYSHPTIARDRGNQASQLLGLYADFKGKDISEVSLREFMGYLNSKPKVLVAAVDVRNPTTNAMVTKNMIAKFV